MRRSAGLLLFRRTENGTEVLLGHMGGPFFARRDAGVSPDEQLLLCDAQTSGGLLAAVPEVQAEAVVRALEAAGTLAAAVVGRIEASGAGRIGVSASRG